MIRQLLSNDKITRYILFEDNSKSGFYEIMITKLCGPGNKIKKYKEYSDVIKEWNKIIDKLNKEEN